MEWKYNGRFWEPPSEFSSDVYYGFVYLITNRATNKKYVGKKFFWFKKTLPITKTRKRRKKLLVESDWKDYYGSNKHLKSDVESQKSTILKKGKKNNSDMKKKADGKVDAAADKFIKDFLESLS